MRPRRQTHWYTRMTARRRLKPRLEGVAALRHEVRLRGLGGEPAWRDCRSRTRVGGFRGRRPSRREFIRRPLVVRHRPPPHAADPRSATPAASTRRRVGTTVRCGEIAIQARMYPPPHCKIRTYVLYLYARLVASRNAAIPPGRECDSGSPSPRARGGGTWPVRRDAGSPSPRGRGGWGVRSGARASWVRHWGCRLSRRVAAEFTAVARDVTRHSRKIRRPDRKEVTKKIKNAATPATHLMR